MGISDLRSLAVIESVDLESIEGSIIAVDFHNWIYRYLTIISRFSDGDVFTTDDGTEVANLLGIIKGVPKFFDYDLAPVFVFDGAVLEEKEAEMQRRKERRNEAAERLEKARSQGKTELARQLRAQTQRFTPTILDTSRELLEILDLPIVDAPAEAEAQAALMAQNDDVDYVATEDYDALLFGAPLTIRQFTSSNDTELMDFEATLAELEVTRQELVDIAILCGTDYNDGVHGVGPKTALKAIRSGDTAEDVLESRGESTGNLDSLRELFLDPNVSTDYSFETKSTPDIEAASDYLTNEWGIPGSAYERPLERLSNQF